jgi:hypothetical protein
MLKLRLPLTVSFLVLAVGSVAATTINQFNVPVIQDFDSLAISGTTNSVLPAGWSFAESGTGANTTYAAGTGSSSTGNTYSFGATGSTDRAFGTLRTSSLLSEIGTEVVNATGATITSLAIAYTGEQWRLGAIGRIDRLAFAYSLDATSLTTGTWLDVAELDFVAPITTGATGALDGNEVANQSAISYTITGLNLVSSATVWLRWSDFVAAGSNDGLAIDQVSISALRTVIPQPPTATVPEGMPSGFLIVVLLGLLRAGAVRGKSEIDPC